MSDVTGSASHEELLQVQSDVSRLQRMQSSLESSARAAAGQGREQTAKLEQQVTSLSRQVESLSASVASLNSRLDELTSRIENQARQSRAAPPPTPAPTPTAVAALVTPAPVPTPQAVETPPPAVSGPAEITAVSPFKMKATGQALLDVHGKGLRPDHQAVLLKGKAGVAGFVVTRQRYMNPGLIMVFVRMDGVAPGKYTLALADGSGALTNQMRVEVTP